jgi:hypothetical protein
MMIAGGDGAPVSGFFLRLSAIILIAEAARTPRASRIQCGMFVSFGAAFGFTKDQTRQRKNQRTARHSSILNLVIHRKSVVSSVEKPPFAGRLFHSYGLD